MRPVTIALVFTAALAGWLASKPLERALRGGGGGGRGRAGPPPRSRPSPRPLLPAVRVRESRAEAVAPELVVNGRTAPARSVVLRAETSGRVVATPVPKGALVEAGAVLVRLDEADRAAKVRQGEARVAQRQIEYDAARRLGERQFQSETKVAEAKAELEESRADLEEARLDLARTEVKAPFKAVLERRPVEVGDYVAPGGEVAHLLEQDPSWSWATRPRRWAGGSRWASSAPRCWPTARRSRAGCATSPARPTPAPAPSGSSSRCPTPPAASRPG
jgi:multidrug efflux system membrane fusion protein